MAHIDLVFAFLRAVTQSRPVSPSNTRLTAGGTPLPVYLVAGIILPLTDLPPKKIAIKDRLRSISRSAKPRSNGFFEFDRISMLVPLNRAGVGLDGIFCSAFRRVTFLHLLFPVTMISLKRSRTWLEDLLPPEFLSLAVQDVSTPSVTWQVLRHLCRHIRFNAHSQLGSVLRLKRCRTMAAGEIYLLSHQRIARQDRQFVGEILSAIRQAV